MTRDKVEVLSRRSRVVVSFIGRRAPIFCGIHVVRGEVTSNGVTISLIFRDGDAELFGSFDQIF
jgi:hypothetical protein